MSFSLEKLLATTTSCLRLVNPFLSHTYPDLSMAAQDIFSQQMLFQLTLVISRPKEKGYLFYG